MEQYINRIQDGYISAVPTHFECINTSKALYDVEVRGDIGHEQLQNFQIEIQNVTLIVCDSTCEISSRIEQNPDSDNTNHTDSDNTNYTDSDDSSSSTMTAMTISVVAIIISGLICIAVVTLLVYVRYRCVV